MSHFSLKKNDKIRKRPEYLYLGKQGKKLRTKHFIILFKGNFEGHCRLGITATKKIGCAVKRNRVKRVLKEFFRLNRSYFKVSTDFVFIAGKGSTQLNYIQVTNELLSALNKKGMIKSFSKNVC